VHLKQKVEQAKGSANTANDSVDKLQQIIDERDDDIDTLKKQVDGDMS
jgi:hypothetical protein